MQPRRLKVDWVSLDEAFNRQHGEVPCYLDRITGHVVLVGEGEDGDADESYGDSAAQASRPDDSTRLHVHPPDTARKLEWFRVFLDRSRELDAGVKAELESAADSEDPAKEIAALLRKNPSESAAWFLFRSDRIHELIDDWLVDCGVEPVEPPPWK